jgi:DNA-binding CsgD family transcriptional regulator
MDVMAIRVGLAGMRPVVAEGVRSWLRQDPRLMVVEAADEADVLVCDSGACVLGLHHRPVVLFTVDRERRELIAEVLEAVPHGRGTASRDVPRLSAREHAALCWWLGSLTKASVARRMGISPHTVEMYIKRIRQKYADLGHYLPTKADLLVRAVADGLYTPEGLAAQGLAGQGLAAQGPTAPGPTAPGRTGQRRDPVQSHSA